MRHFTDTELVDLLAEYTEAEKEAKRMGGLVRDELLRRQLESGELEIEHNGWESKLKRSPYSTAWLKKEMGYEINDLPDGCVGEKVVPDVQWDKVVDWLSEEGFTFNPPMTIAFSKKKGSINE